MIFSDHTLPLQKIGSLRRLPSRDIRQSAISVGMECLDRDVFNFDRCYEQLGAIGVKWARVQTGWCKCETRKGEYDFAWLDHIVDSLLAVGVQPWFNLGFGNKLYMPDVYTDAAVGFVPLYYPEGLVAWKKFVSAVARHFHGRVRRWEIWNEPEGKNFWQPTNPDPREYARLIRETAPLIRADISDAEIGSCLAGMVNLHYFPGFVATGIASELDFHCFHNYNILPELNLHRAVQAQRRSFAAHGGSHLKLAMGEGGYASYFPAGHWMGTHVMASEKNQAKWLLRRIVADLGEDLMMTSFFQMADMMEKPYSMGDVTRKDPARHGLLNGLSYTPKMSYYAMASAAALFDDETLHTDLYAQPDTTASIPRGTPVSRLFDLALSVVTFTRKGFPIYAYHIPEDVQCDFPGYRNFQLHFLPGEAGRPICNPVLIDMLAGTVYAVTNTASVASGIHCCQGLPIVDYPLLLTDRDAISDRIDDK